MTTRTFLDSGVLIAAFRGSRDIASPAIRVLNDSDRVFLTSELVRLEVLPKAVFHRQSLEVEFYLQFFADVAEEARITSELVDQAFTLAARWNLNALDALHIAAAIQLGADEFLTTERPTSPLIQVSELRIISIRQ